MENCFKFCSQTVVAANSCGQKTKKNTPGSSLALFHDINLAPYAVEKGANLVPYCIYWSFY